MRTQFEIESNDLIHTATKQEIIQFLGSETVFTLKCLKNANQHTTFVHSDEALERNILWYNRIIQVLCEQ